MKILYIITKSEFGGAQTHIFQLCRQMLREGNEVAAMSFKGGWLEDKIRELGGVFYPNEFLSNSFNPFKGLKAMKVVKKALKDFNPDLVSCHSTSAGFWARLAIRNKVPTIFTAHGWAFTKGVSCLRKVFAIDIEKFVSRFCKKIICVSEFDKSLALKYGITKEEKLLTIHNGVEIEDIDLEKKDYSYPIKIVFVGRLSAPKNPKLLVSAFSELLDELKAKAEISIIGEGEDKKDVEKFIKEKNLESKVKLLGALEREKVFEVLKNSHIFVLISFWEGFPRSILEAMMHGVPVIASNVGGIKESVKSNCGFLIEGEDILELKKKLEELIKNPILIKELGKNSRESIIQKFSLEKMIEKTKEVYNYFLKKS